MNNYMNFLQENKHEYQVFNTIKEMALNNGFAPAEDHPGHKKLIFEFRNKLIALVEVGTTNRANLVVSHIDSPRLDVIPNDPFVEKDDGVFVKVQDFGGIIPQSWLDRPLVLIGKAYNKNGDLVLIDSDKDNVYFTIASLLPHLDGREEMKKLDYDKLLVNVGTHFFDYMKKEYGVSKENMILADLSFVPKNDVYELGYEKELIAGYGHDDRSCAYAELRAMLDSKHSDNTKIALFTCYEETGSAQSSGAQSEFIDDIFLYLANGNYFNARYMIRNTKVLSADVCMGYDHKFDSHFESNCKAICGKGVGIVPFTGRKSGNDATIEMREYVRKLAANNNIEYQLETTKVTERGGGTVAKFFATRGMEVIDVGIPVLAMHSPQELIHENDLEQAYRLYKVFFEN